MADTNGGALSADSTSQSISKITLTPVSTGDRIELVDILRGLALLGILMINIEYFAHPSPVLFYPPVSGGFEGLNLLFWKFTYIIFHQKMMGIFAMLFGAGLVLMFEKARKLGSDKFAGIWYRRMLWLGLFGIIHAYFIWLGDILFPYAICGLILYPLRRLSARWLLIWGIIVFMIGVGISFGTGHLFEYMKKQKVVVAEAEAAGETPPPMAAEMARNWDNILRDMVPTPEKVRPEIEARRGGYWEMTKYFFPITLASQTMSFIYYIIWRVLGTMLIGMALMKSGVFTGQKSFKFYAILMIIGYGLGLPLAGYGAGQLMAHGFDPAYSMRAGMLYDHMGGLFVSLAHVSLLIFIYRFGYMKWLTRRLAAVGRTAFSNYLFTSLVMGFIFYGIGLGLFARIEKFYLLFFVLGMWIIQLIISPLWLSRFRFGPLEWLWRTLTYKKAPSMKINTGT